MIGHEDFKNKRIIVFGASSGIGRSTSVLLSELGAQLVLVARRKEKLEETLALMKENNHVVSPFDVTNTEAVGEVFDACVSKVGKLDGMVFSVGIAPTIPCKATTPKLMLEIMNTNFFSFYETTRQFSKKKYSNDCSKIVAVSSAASIRPAKGQSAYSVSKAAIDIAVKCFAKELCSRNICINCVRPGFVDTPMVQQFKEQILDANDNIAMQPLGIVQPEEVANLILYLLSSNASKLTGNAYDIDGGSLL